MGAHVPTPIPAVPEIPRDEAHLRTLLADPIWRLTSGHLYKIKTKIAADDDDAPGLVVPFAPNAAQRDLYANLHTRNSIPKARQLGLSTAIQVLMLDQCVFVPETACLTIAAPVTGPHRMVRFEC